MLIRGPCAHLCAHHTTVRSRVYVHTRIRIKRPQPRYITPLALPSFPTPPPNLPLALSFFLLLLPSLFLVLSLLLSVYACTQIPRVDVGTVISPESKAPASGVGTSVREFLNPFLHDSCSAWPGLRLCPGLACCRLRVVGIGTVP